VNLQLVSQAVPSVFVPFKQSEFDFTHF
jgi:hypothetical protein